MPNPEWPMRTIAQLTLIGTAFTNQIVNVHHFQAATATESGLAGDTERIAWGATLAADWITNMKASWLATHPADYVLNLVKVQVIECPGQFRRKLTAGETPLSTANVGTVGTSASNSMDCANLKWKTQVAGKSHRGRTYISPITNNWIAAGQLSGPGVTAVTAYGTAMCARWGVGGTAYNGSALTVYSRAYNEGEYQYTQRVSGSIVVVTPVEYDGDATNIASALADPIIRTQRRRQFGKGS